MSKKKNKKKYSKENKPITNLETGCYFCQENAWDMLYNTFPEFKSLHINFSSCKFKWTEDELLEQFFTKHAYEDRTKSGKSTYYCVFQPKEILKGIPNAYRIPDRHFVNSIITDDFVDSVDELAGLKFELDHSSNVVRGCLVVIKGCQGD